MKKLKSSKTSKNVKLFKTAHPVPETRIVNVDLLANQPELHDRIQLESIDFGEYITDKMTEGTRNVLAHLSQLGKPARLITASNWEKACQEEKRLGAKFSESISFENQLPEVIRNATCRLFNSFAEEFVLSFLRKVALAAWFSRVSPLKGFVERLETLSDLLNELVAEEAAALELASK